MKNQLKLNLSKILTAMLAVLGLVLANSVQAQTVFYTTNTTANFKSSFSGVPFAWSNAPASFVPPSAGGSNNYVLTINSANCTLTNDLGTPGNAGFQLNQLSAGKNMTNVNGAADNALVFMATDAGVNPSITGAGSLNLNTPITLSNNLTIATTASGTTAASIFDTLNGVISGTGDITNNRALNAGQLVVTNNNTFSGNWILNSSVVKFSTDASIGNATNQIIVNSNAAAYLLAAANTFTNTRLVTVNDMGAFGGGNTALLLMTNSGVDGGSNVNFLAGSMVLHSTGNTLGAPVGVITNDLVFGLAGASATNLTNMIIGSTAGGTNWHGVGSVTSQTFGQPGGTLTLSGDADMVVLASGTTLTMSNQITGGDPSNILRFRGNGSVNLTISSDNFTSKLAGSGGSGVGLSFNYPSGTHNYTMADGMNNFGAIIVSKPISVTLSSGANATNTISSMSVGSVTNTIFCTNIISGGAWTNNGALNVGSGSNSDSNRLVMTGITWFNKNVANLGNTTNESYNSIYVTNSTWDMGGAALNIGNSAFQTNNSMTVDNAVITNINSVSFGNSSGNSSNVYGGSLLITNGGKVYFTNVCWFGYGASSNNVTVTGTGSLLTYIENGTTPSMFIGITKTNTQKAIGNSMFISNGAQVICKTFGVGRVAPTPSGGCSNNFVVIGGNGATLDSGSSIVTVGQSDTTNCYMILNAGGIVTGRQIVVGAAGSGLGTLYFNGGSFVAKSAGVAFNTGSDGKILVQAGGATINDGGFAITTTMPLLPDASSPGGGLTKLGVGSLTLSGTNTYTGPTTVSAGALLVNGSLAAASTLTNLAGSTLGGSGTIGGATTLSGSAILAPGANSIGTLTFSGNLKLSATSTNTFAVTTAGGVSNTVVVTGQLSPNNSVVSITTGASLAVGTYTNLFTYGTLVGSFNATPVFDVAPAGTATIVNDGVGHINLVISGGSSLSANAYLTSLALTPAGALSPSFATNGFSYTATNAFTDIPTVTVTNADSTATNTLFLNGVSQGAITSGVPSMALTLNVGSNNVAVQVVSQDLSVTNLYTVNVTKLAAPLSANAYLTALAISPAGTLSPAFTTNGLTYTATNAYANNPVTVTATSGDANATLQLSFNGGSFTTPVTNSLSIGSQTLNLAPSPLNTVAVKVTAQDGVTTNLYTVNVLLQPSLAAFKVTNSVVGGTNLVLTWPVDHTGYSLLTQTNNLNKGVSKNTNDWGTLGYTTTNAAVIPITKTNLNSYYRLVYP